MKQIRGRTSKWTIEDGYWYIDKIVKNGRPENLDQSEGRFIVQTNQLLDPAIYQKDMLLTVVGTLKGSKVLSIGGFEYTYPLVKLIEIKLCPKGMQIRPIIHFGIGVGTSF